MLLGVRLCGWIWPCRKAGKHDHGPSQKQHAQHPASYRCISRSLQCCAGRAGVIRSRSTKLSLIRISPRVVPDNLLARVTVNLTRHCGLRLVAHVDKKNQTQGNLELHPRRHATHTCCAAVLCALARRMLLILSHTKDTALPSPLLQYSTEGIYCAQQFSSTSCRTAARLDRWPQAANAVTLDLQRVAWCRRA